MDQNWFKNAVIYGVDVKLFYDGNNDGIGDFVGLTQKLPYIKSLGVDCIWLLPFHPSGGRDNGYDVIDHYSIDQSYGTLDDFRNFVTKARKMGIRVLMDLVVHHTSDLNPWFLESRSNVNSKYRNFYVWSKKIPKGNYPESRPAFPGVDNNVWKYDPVAKMFYFHRFYNFQPDLNVANPEVQAEIIDIMRFWLNYGISGFRLDAATMMFERKGIEGTGVKNADAFIEEMHRFVKGINPDAIILGEADVKADEVSFFFGNGNRISLLLNFLLNRYIFLGLARGDGEPIAKELTTLPKPPHSAQWVNFLRNLDELNIETLDPGSKSEVFNEFGKEPWTRVYDRGIRRRLAAMMDGNLKRMKMAYSLIFSLPGTPMIVYGDEIGMGDFLDLPERESVRLPMQWNSQKNAGFSKVDRIGLIRAALEIGPFRYQILNTKSEIAKKDSLLNYIKTLCKVRKNFPEIGEGDYNVLETSDKRIFAISFTNAGSQLITFHNLSKNPAKTDLMGLKNVSLKEVFSDSKYSDPNSHIKLNSYGFRWFKVLNK